MNSKGKFPLLLILVLASVLVVRVGLANLPGKSANHGLQGKMALVVRVIDGDTIVLEGGERVRYIGIDTPESKHPRRPVEPLAVEATELNRILVENKRVFLLMGRKPRDKYKRLLAYVFVGDIFVNARLIREGYARERAYPPNMMFQPLFMELQEDAKTTRKGIWGSK